MMCGDACIERFRASRTSPAAVAYDVDGADAFARTSAMLSAASARMHDVLLRVRARDMVFVGDDKECAEARRVVRLVYPCACVTTKYYKNKSGAVRA
jgi:hypothetical protein